MEFYILPLISMLSIYLLIPETDSLWCYQCGDVNMDSPCVTDYKGMNKSAIMMEGKYAKDCSNQYIGQNTSTFYCLIETHSKGGGSLLSFRRDCSDGVHFSYNLDTKVGNIPQLEDLRPHNQSTCVYLVDTLICLRLCVEDFCNGPRPNQTTECGSGNTTCGSTSLVNSRYSSVFGHILSAPFIVCVVLVLIFQ